MQQLWEHTLTRRMHLDTSLTPLLLTEAAFNTPQLRAKYKHLHTQHRPTLDSITQ